VNSLDAIASSMSADTRRMTTLSQNLVNATTPGYKREVTRAHGFSTLLQTQAPDTQGLSTASAIDMRPGSVRHTGQALDIAIDAPNVFLEVQTPEGPAYTRRGDLHIDEQGRLCDHAGHPVMGASGPLSLPMGVPVIGADGSIRIGGDTFGRLRLVQLTRTDGLQRLGGSLFGQTGAEPIEAAQATVRQHHLEVSNVDSASEMVTLMETMRHFESGQKVLQGIDDMHERALRKLGEF
jgi:flagellar basal-body rod protein FlgF